jgi:hypothetical protein
MGICRVLIGQQYDGQKFLERVEVNYGRPEADFQGSDFQAASVL